MIYQYWINIPIILELLSQLLLLCSGKLENFDKLSLKNYTNTLIVRIKMDFMELNMKTLVQLYAIRENDESMKKIYEWLTLIIWQLKKIIQTTLSKN